MKKFFVFFIFVLSSITTFSQPFYSKVTTPSQFLSSAALENMVIKNDTVIFNTYPVEEVDGEFYSNTYLTMYRNDGNLISATKLGVESTKSKLLIDGPKIYSLGAYKERTRDSLQILMIEKDKVTQKLEVFNPYNYQGLGAHYELLKYNNQFIILCSGMYSLKQLDYVHKPYIIWINEDFTLDSVMQLDLPYGELFDYGIDDDGHLNILAQYHSGKFKAGPDTTRNYQGYIKINGSKKIIHSYFEEQKDWRFQFTSRPRGVFYPDGTKIVTGPIGFEMRINGMNNKDSIIWTDSTYRDQNIKRFEHRSYSKCQNGDVLVLATSFIRSWLPDYKPDFESSFIQRYDKYGNEKFFRSYGYYNKPTDRSEGNWLDDLREMNPNNIIAIGFVASRDQHSVYPGEMFNDSTWILSVDSMGCIDKNKCNDIIVWNAPNHLYQYDQINVRHKEWYFSNNTGRYSQTFGRDTNMFDNKYNWIRYRPIVYRNLDTGVETKDTVFATWTPEGRMYISGKKKCDYCEEPIYPLYDFSLLLHDTFTLPYDYGKAIIVKVDSITLISGYLRKRMVLQHLNAANQAKYGDLIWIEGIGSPNGILYYNDWKQGTKTELTCYYDRDEKRYSSTDDPDCRKPILVSPEFTTYGPYCVGSEAGVLPQMSSNTLPISGKWSPESINTKTSGTYNYLFTPNDGQNADTTSMLIEIIDKILPEFDVKTNYNVNDVAELLPIESINGIAGTWSPASIDTKKLGSSSYLFLPIEASCALAYTIEINVSILTDTTDMDRSTVWYSSSFIGNFANGDCRRKIDITRVMRDTLISNRLCRIIGVTSGGAYFAESEIIVYSKDNKMHFYEDNTWKLLYDFTVNIGDTVTYYVSKKYLYYGIFAVPVPFDQELVNDNPYQLIIKGIDSIYTSTGAPLKRFKTERVFNVHGHFMDDIIVPIGSMEKLFGNNIVIIPPQCDVDIEKNAGLRCYSDDDIFIKYTEEACDMLTSVRGDLVAYFKIYPNPGTSSCTVAIGDEVVMPLTYEVISLDGRRHETGYHTSRIDLRIATDALPAGLYVIRMRDAVGNVGEGRWMKVE